MNKLFKTDVINCARCGHDHEQLEFKPFKNPVENHPAPLTHWALCPKLEEPILLALIYDIFTGNDKPYAQA